LTDQALGRATFAVDLVNGPAGAFGPLETVLASISVVCAQHQVHFYAPVQGPPLTVTPPEHSRHQGQDRHTSFACCHAGEAFQGAHK